MSLLCHTKLTRCYGTRRDGSQQRHSSGLSRLIIQGKCLWTPPQSQISSSTSPKNLEISLLTQAHSTLNCVPTERGKHSSFSSCWGYCHQLCLRFMSQQKITFQQRQRTPDLPEQEGPNFPRFSAVTASTDLNEATSTTLQDYSPVLPIFNCSPHNTVTPSSCSGTGRTQDSFLYFTLQWSLDRTSSLAPAKILVMQITHPSQQRLACRQLRASNTQPCLPGWNPPHSSEKILPQQSLTAFLRQKNPQNSMPVTRSQPLAALPSVESSQTTPPPSTGVLALC